MPDYAYRAVDAEGKSLRIAVAAASAEEALVRARGLDHHVVMLYALRGGEKPYYERLMSEPNLPLPPRVRNPRELTSGELRWSTFRARLRTAIRDGRIQGDCGWFQTSVDTRSLVAPCMQALRKMVFDEMFEEHADKMELRESQSSSVGASPVPPLDPGSPCWQSVLETCPVVQIGEDWRPPFDEVGMSQTLCRVYQVLPYSREEGRILVLAAHPENLGVLEDIRFMLGSLGAEFGFVRCREVPVENAQVVESLIRKFTADLTRTVDELLEEMGTVSSSDTDALWHQDREFGAPEDWEGTARGLPPLPVEHDRWDAGRAGEFICAAAAGALGERRDLDVPTFRLCQLTVLEALRKRSDGFRVRPEGGMALLEEHREGAWIATESPPNRLRQEIIATLAAAAGIEPTALPPARGEVRVTDGRVEYRVSAETHMTEDGEQIEVRWARS